MTEVIETRSIQQLAENGYDVTLQAVKSQRIFHFEHGWIDWSAALSNDDIVSISELLGGHEKTQNKVATKLRSLSTIPNHWGFDRIHFSKHTKRWAYCAGQYYPGELSMIRKWFLGL